MTTKVNYDMLTDGAPQWDPDGTVRLLGPWTIGTLGYTASNYAFALQTNVNAFAQGVIRNTSQGPSASADFIVNNNLSTDTSYYGDFGINSSLFSGTGSFSLPNATYAYAHGGDMVVGTYSANYLRFVVNNGAFDAMTIEPSSGNVAINATTFGEKLTVGGNILVSDGAGANYIEVRNGSNWTGRLAASATGKFSLQYYNGSAWTNGATLDSSGNFGVGVAPAYRFHVTGADGTVALINGATKGIRVICSSTGSTLEGVDSTGAASYQPLAIGGLSLQFTLSAVEKAKIDTSGNLLVTGGGGLGYGTGSGGAVSQATSRTTGVTLSKTTGSITLFSTTTTAGQTTTFTVTNTTVVATDTIVVTQQTGAGIYFFTTKAAAGSFNLSVYTPAAVAAAEAPVLNFAVIKAVAA